MAQVNDYPYNSRYELILQHNSITNEPFIALPAPHSNVRLTSAQLSDVDSILPIMNSPDVAMNFSSPPFPFLRVHCEAWLRDRVRDYENTMIHIRNVDGDVGYIDVFPLRHIREVGPNGAEIFLGDVGLDREDAFEDIGDVEARKARVAENAGPPTGDSDIVWSFGDYIRSTHRGRGIMTAIVKTIIESWAIPHMNARKYGVSAFTDNIGSQKVFLKNGFQFTRKIEGVVTFPESKGGHVKDCYCYRLEIPG
ncbi:unnamed protein product [Rhizoctonia solani]|uniref:N-acetyltransferase domain-containing protein n=1 Tax=Rhizoctonia solani TaxID=456999 RepID=A0A8H3DNY6_9AGAM|nr:unnamed protein product [Rhizoctonia solani]